MITYDHDAIRMRQQARLLAEQNPTGWIITVYETSWREAEADLTATRAELQRLGEELSARLSCSSPDFAAELGEIERLQADLTAMRAEVEHSDACRAGCSCATCRQIGTSADISTHAGAGPGLETATDRRG